MNTEILLNGESHVLQGADTVAALVQQLDLHNQRIAVELNHESVLRSEYAGTRLNAGDRVEIVHAIGGG